MKKTAAIFVLGLLVLQTAIAQENWVYKRDISFPAADSGWVRPYLMTIDASNNLWTFSTNSIDSACHNAVFKAPLTGTMFTKVYDFTTQENDIFSQRGLSGITATGNSIVVFSRVPSGTDVAGHAFYLPDGNPDNKQGFGPSGGYGTVMYGACATKDSTIYSGISAWGISIRVHNFSKRADADASAFGTWIPFSTTDGSTAPKDPGGLTVDGSALIRDLALLPKGNYSDTNTVFYTSRNSEKGIQNGGVVAWKGGTQWKAPVNPEKYRGQKVVDLDSDLLWAITSPNGITVDSLGRLWACGSDTTRRWVRVYSVDLTSDPAYAMRLFELPGQYSSTPEAKGARMLAPADVVVKGNSAFVSDILTRKIYVFEKSMTSVDQTSAAVPAAFLLEQNFPNPFNPATKISFSLPTSGMVTLKVFNLLGQEIAVLVNEYREAGSYAALFNGDTYGLSSGLYLYQLTANGMSSTKKMALTK